MLDGLGKCYRSYFLQKKETSLNYRHYDNPDKWCLLNINMPSALDRMRVHLIKSGVKVAGQYYRVVSLMQIFCQIFLR